MAETYKKSMHMGHHNHPDSVPITRGDSAKPADGTFAGAEIPLASGATVSFEQTETAAKDGHDYSSQVELGKKKTKVSANLDADDDDHRKTIDVVGADGKEHYVYNDGLHDKMLAAIDAIKKGTFTKEEAEALKSAHEKLVGSMVNGTLAEDKVPAVVAAYEAARKEGLREL